MLRMCLMLARRATKLAQAYENNAADRQGRWCFSLT